MTNQAELNVGDELIEYRRSGPVAIRKVVRVSKTLAWIGVPRDDGSFYEVRLQRSPSWGQTFNAPRADYHNSHYYRVDDERRRELQFHKVRRTAKEMLGQINPDALTNAELQSLIEALQPFIQSK